MIYEVHRHDVTLVIYEGIEFTVGDMMDIFDKRKGGNVRLFNRKGMIFPIVVMGVIAVAVMLIMISWFARDASRGSEGFSTALSSTGDCDNDGASNFIDDCPCTYGSGNSEFPGCPSSARSEDDLAQYQCSDEEKASC